MLFRFRNIGKIAEADIEINGLTVLGGHNDTGKSTEDALCDYQNYKG